MSNFRGFCTVWLTLSLSYDHCLPGAGSLSALTWGDPMGATTFFRVSVSPARILCATVWIPMLRHCSVVLKAKLSYSLAKYSFPIPSLLFITSTFLDNWHIFGMPFVLYCPCWVVCNFHEQYLPLSFCSFPQNILLVRILFLFYNILGFF